MSKFVSRFAKNESGATAIEYGLIVALIAVVIIGAVTAVGTNLVQVQHGRDEHLTRSSAKRPESAAASVPRPFLVSQGSGAWQCGLPRTAC